MEAQGALKKPPTGVGGFKIGGVPVGPKKNGKEF